VLDIPSISAIVATVGVLVGVVFTYLEVRNLVKQRQTDLVIKLHSTFGSKELQEAYFAVRTWDFFKDYDDFMKKYVVSQAVQIAQVCMFFEGVGVLLQRKLLNIGLVSDLFGAEVKLAWKAVKPIIEGRRKDLNEPKIYEWFEYLYNEVKKKEHAGVKNG